MTFSSTRKEHDSLGDIEERRKLLGNDKTLCKIFSIYV